MKKKIDLKRFRIASLTTMKRLRGGTGDDTGSFETDGAGGYNTLPPQCLTNTEPDPDYKTNSENPLTPNTCIQTSAVQVSGNCHLGN